MAKMTTNEIAKALKDGEKHLPEAVQRFRGLGERIEQVLDQRDRVDAKLEEAHREIALAVETRDSAAFEAAVEKSQKLLADRDDTDRIWRTFWDTTLLDAFQPVADAVHAAICVSHVLPVLQKVWTELDPEIQREVHKAVGSRIAL